MIGLRPLEAMEFGSGNAECGKENLEWGRRMRDEGGREKMEDLKVSPPH